MLPTIASSFLRSLRAKARKTQVFLQTFQTAVELDIARDHFHAETRDELTNCLKIFEQYAEALFPYDGKAQQRLIEEALHSNSISTQEIFRFQRWYYDTYVARWYKRHVWTSYCLARIRIFFQTLKSH